MKDYIRRYYPAFDNFRSQVNCLVEDLMGGISSSSGSECAGERHEGKLHPAVRVIEGEAAVEVFVELPGVEESRLEVTAGPSWIRVRGEKPEPPAGNDTRTTISEIAYGKFEREFALPCRVDEKEVSASFKNGVLAVLLRRAADERPDGVRIEIRNG